MDITKATLTGRALVYLASFVLGFFLTASDLSYATPYELPYSGRLTEDSGKPVAGPITIKIVFYRSPTGNDPVNAVSITPFQDVQLNDGIFQITLALSPAEFHLIFNETENTWIQVTDATHGRTYPRQKISMVPYALKVPVDGQSVTYNVDGKLILGRPEKLSLKARNTDHAITLKSPDTQATGLTFILPGSVGAAGQFLATDGAGGLNWANIPGGGDMLKANNLSELTSPASARSNLGLGNAATKNVGSMASDVAPGQHTHLVGDVAGLGPLATKNAIGTSDIIDGTVTGNDIAPGAITDAHIHATAEISYLKISGLGSAASKNVGTGSNDVATGDHSHNEATTSSPGFISPADKAKLNNITTSAVITQNANYAVQASDNGKTIVVTDTSSVTLPPAANAGNGFEIQVKRKGSGMVRVVNSGSESIDDLSSTVSLAAPNSLVKVMSDGTNWHIINTYGTVRIRNLVADGGGTYQWSDGFTSTTCAEYMADAAIDFKGTGTYWIDPDGAGGNGPIKAYCDMTTDGGGWTLFAIVSATRCAELLPYGPLALDSLNASEYFSTAYNGAPHTRFLQIVKNDGVSESFRITYDFITGSKTIATRMTSVTSPGEAVNWTVTQGTTTVATFTGKTWRYSSSSGVTAAKLAGSGSTGFSADDGAWGAANGTVDGTNGSAFSGASGWGFGNLNSSDSLCANVYQNGVSSSQPGMRTWLYFK